MNYIDKFIKPIEIAGELIPNNLWFAPLAGYSDKSLRSYIKKFGAGFSFTEMVPVDNIIRGDKRVLKSIAELEDHTSIQLVGNNNPDQFYKACRILLKIFPVRIIDTNFGCPVKNIINNKSGAYLLNEPEKMRDIIKAVKDSGAIASAKIRSGFDQVNIQSTIQALNDGKVDIITIHPRLAAMYYNGKADWEIIKQARILTKAVLIANGDIISPEAAKKIVLLTGADGIMIGRQAVGAPYIFQQIKEFFLTERYNVYPFDKIKEWMLEYSELYIRNTGKNFIKPIRSILIQFIKKNLNSDSINYQLSQIIKLQELEQLLKNYSECFKNIPVNI